MEVEKIAKLAALILNEEEKNKFNEEFKKIIEWIDSLNDIDTTNVEAFPYTLKSLDTYDDIPINFEKQELIIKNFTNREYDFLKVKKVIE